jgi:hypothetical protein
MCRTSADCAGTTPVCNASGTCEACDAPGDCPGAQCATSGPLMGACGQCDPADDAGCSGSTSLCDPATIVCGECIANADCAGTTPACNPISHVCEPCDDDGDCTAAAPRCVRSGAGAGSCAACADAKPQGALEFDGDDFIVIPNTWNVSNFAMTVEAWFKTDVPVMSQSMILAKSGGSYGFFLNLFTNDTVTDVAGFQIETSGCVGASTLSDGAWHHIAGTWGETLYAVRLYVDGVLVCETASVWGFTNSSWDIVIGAAGRPPGVAYGDPHYFTGRIDQVSMWNGARTLAQIQGDMAAPLTGAEGGLVFFYDFDGQGCGQTLMDQSGSEFHAPLGSSTSEDLHDPEWVSDSPF